MGVNLQKGQKIDLKKQNGSELNQLLIGLGWDQSKKSGGFFSGKKKEIDCDASVILCGSNGKLLPGGPTKCCIYFANKRNANDSIIHHGDNLTGGGSGDDEQITLSLSNIPADTDKLVFVVNIYDGKTKNQHFGLIKNAFIRIVDTDNNTEICRFDLSENYDGMTGLITGEIYRKDGSWKFNAIGQPVKEASKLDQLLSIYS